MFRPQRPQKREFSGRDAEHRGHGYVPSVCARVTRVNDPLPQRPQNLTPSANREPQLAHATIPGMTLEAGEPMPLLPCDDDGWLGEPWTGFNCACMTCSLVPSRISITRSSSRSPGFETLKICLPAGISVRTTRPELPTLPFRSSFI